MIILKQRNNVSDYLIDTRDNPILFIEIFQLFAHYNSKILIENRDELLRSKYKTEEGLIELHCTIGLIGLTCIRFIPLFYSQIINNFNNIAVYNQ